MHISGNSPLGLDEFDLEKDRLVALLNLFLLPSTSSSLLSFLFSNALAHVNFW